jgi:hypothetical protein
MRTSVGGGILIGIRIPERDPGDATESRRINLLQDILGLPSRPGIDPARFACPANRPLQTAGTVPAEAPIDVE